MKWLLWLTLGLASLLLVLGLLLTYWFPSNLVRQELEVRLSKLLQGTVTIRTLAFNALTGLQVRNLEYRKPDQPLLALERLTLDYSLLGLLTGTFTVNEVTVERADISLNLPELTQEVSQEASDVSPEEGPRTTPSFPVSIDLDTLAIIDSHLQVTVSPDLEVALTKLNLHSSGALSSDKANLKGQLTIDRLDVDVQDKHLQLPLDMTLDTQIDFTTEHFNLDELTIAVDNTMRFTLSGTVSKFFTPDEINFSLTDTELYLDSLFTLAKEFVPAKWASSTIQGSLSPTIFMDGTLSDGQFSGTMQTDLQTNNLQLNLPSQALELGPTSLDIQTKDIHIQHNQPTAGSLTVKTSIKNSTFQSYRLENLDAVLASNGNVSGPFSGTLNLSGSTIIPPDILGTSFPLPFDLSLDTEGNYLTREVHMNNLDLDLDSFGSLQAKGKVSPHPSQNPDMDASLELRIQPHLQALLSLLPQDQLQGLIVDASGEPETLVFRATGLLQKDFQPKWATATAALKLSPINVTSNNVGISSDIDQLTFLLSSQYQQEQGVFQGTMGLSTKFSGLQVKESVNLETIKLNLKSSFKGNLSPTFQPINIRSNDQLHMMFQNINYADPSLTASLPYLKLFLHTKEDLLKQDYVVEQFKIISEDLLDLNMQGRFTQETQGFKINLEAPLLHIGNFLPHLSGPLMEGIATINPSGRLKLTLQAAGRIPEKTDWEKLELPLGLKSTVTLRGLAGAVAGYQLHGGNGTLSFGYSPKALPQTQLTTGIQVDHIGLPTTFPFQELRDTALELNLTSPDLNEVNLDPFQVTAQGIDFSTKAVLVGLREFFDSSTTAPGAQFAKLFVELQTRLGLDLEPFQQALQTYGVSGSGGAQVNLNLHKQEQGDLSASLNLDAEKLSIVQDGTKIQDMNGSVLMRKALRWDSETLMAPSKKRFLPSDRIAQLKRFSEKRHQISINKLTLGPLPIHHLSAHIGFQEHTLRIQNLAMNLLEGGIGGNVALALGSPLRLTAGIEIANLNINELLKKKDQISGDSRIAATLAIDTRLQEETGAIDLSRLTCQINITHIGKEALDRLLVFLDPEGSNPTLSNARAQLKLANPSQVNIDIARGQLNLVIEFQGSLLPTFTLKRIPIAKMKHVEKLTAAIPNWEALIPVLNMVGAETYHFSPEGELIFQ